MAQKFGAVLTFKDNMSASIRGIKKEQSAFRKDVKETRKALESTYKKKHELRLNHTEAAKKIKQLKKDLEPLRKKVITTMAYKDMIRGRIKTIKNELKLFGRTIARPAINLKDNVTGKLISIKNFLFSIRGIAAGLAVGTMLSGAGSILSKGANLEKQQISMEHFIGINNKGSSTLEVKSMRDDYLKQLRENANKTPFETSEVIAAGTRAIGIAGGSTKDAMELVKVAEDMAALTPGKTVQDAMEALADAKNGEMERLKEFNAKVSADEYKKLGFKGVVDTRLKSQFAGGADKLANSGSGLWSTIKGKLGSKTQDIGIKALDALKPALKSAIELIDKYSPKMDKIAESVGSGINKGIKHIGKFKDYVSSYMPQIKSSISWAADTIRPAFDLIVSGAKLAYNIFKWAFPGIKAVTESVWSVVKPIIEGLSSAIGWLAEKAEVLSSVINGNSSGTKQAKVTSAPRAKGQKPLVHGKHRNGIDRIPFDGYIAELHKDESVKTASETKAEKRSKSKSILIAKLMDKLADTIIIREEADIDKIADKLVTKIDLALANMQGGA